MRDHEIVLPRRVVQQPTPHLNPGGDCGACVLGGLFGIEVGDAYKLADRDKIAPISHSKMRSALWESSSRGLADRIVVEPARWPNPGEGYFDDFGHLAGRNAIEWWTYLRLACDAGYYGIAEVDSNKGGPYGGGTDHWVLLCGIRRTCPPDSQSGAIHQDVLVSCSSTKTPDEEWVDAGDFLRHRGGFNMLLARPKG